MALPTQAFWRRASILATFLTHLSRHPSTFAPQASPRKVALAESQELAMAAALVWFAKVVLTIKRLRMVNVPRAAAVLLRCTSCYQLG